MCPFLPDVPFRFLCWPFRPHELVVSQRVVWQGLECFSDGVVPMSTGARLFFGTFVQEKGVAWFSYFALCASFISFGPRFTTCHAPAAAVVVSSTVVKSSWFSP